MRWALLIPVVLLGFGGIALAQPGMIVDPWSRPTAVANSAQCLPAAASVEALSCDVPPIASGLEVQVERTRRLPRPSRAYDVAAVASGLDLEPTGVPNARPAGTPRAANWSERREIVEPWKRMPRLATISVANLIVDPWAPPR